MNNVNITEADGFIIKVSNIISGNEGNFDSINQKDGFSSSIGMLQWSGYRAKKLLKLISSKNLEKAEALLAGTTIFVDINKEDSFWNSRILDSYECEKISQLLTTKEGIIAQYETFMQDVKAYIDHGKSLDIRDEKALAFFADLENQLGYYVVEKIIQTMDKEKVLSIYNILIASVSNSALMIHKNRRMYTYHRIMNTIF